MIFNNIINGVLLLAIVGVASIQANRLVAVEIVPDKQTAVKQGEELKIVCKVPMELQVCRFVIPREGDSGLILKPGPQSEDGIDYFGEGLEKGYCGIRLAKVRENDDGNYTCAITPKNARTESVNSVRVIVAREPSMPTLELAKDSFRAGEKMDIVCHSDGGKPPANLSLFIDKEQIQYDERPLVYGRYDESVAMLKTSRAVSIEDHGKTLTCTASHIALSTPKSASQQINVEFPPEKQEKIERFGYTIGQAGKVNVTVRANPMPAFTWVVGEQRIAAGQPDNTHRIQTSSPVDMGHGFWGVEFLIDSVQKSDTDKPYILEAVNRLGTESYRIILSSATEPAGVDMEAGSIIGIVIGVLILIFAVFLVVFARATGRWCFAARRRGDEEAAEGAGAGSEAHITPGSDEDDEQHEHEQHIINDEKVPPISHGQENPVHASTEYVNGRNDINNKDVKTDTPV
ncbi:fasciclin-3 isoform X2 [Phymastichus coffea]|uniref:fasciclin-3 isoform X2 n=1 Tax=Phymastichus coffea TaxID=108790 RepID=UPI00273C022F|nr:fasciclin-3 isoform X2 [Phymastichus coffea]